jgi:hypothetical protein
MSIYQARRAREAVCDLLDALQNLGGNPEAPEDRFVTWRRP